MKLGTGLALLFLVAGTSSAAAVPPKKFDITAFFTGRTHADNNIKIVFHRTGKLIVDSVGRMKGTDFVLEDTVHEQGKPVRMRKWVMHPIGTGHYGGTLSDAVGPVDVEVTGNSATIRYVMAGGLNIVQQMQLQPGGRALSNHVEARKFGLKFATVDGIIRKLD